MPNPFMPFTSETALRPFRGRLAAVFYPIGYPTPYGHGEDGHPQGDHRVYPYETERLLPARSPDINLTCLIQGEMGSVSLRLELLLPE
jgi:hypothetical protein